jgi:hypothetical protein
MQAVGVEQSDAAAGSRHFVSRVTAMAKQYYEKAQRAHAPDALPRAGDD